MSHRFKVNKLITREVCAHLIRDTDVHLLNDSLSSLFRHNSASKEGWGERKELLLCVPRPDDAGHQQQRLSGVWKPWGRHVWNQAGDHQADPCTGHDFYPGCGTTGSLCKAPLNIVVGMAEGYGTFHHLYGTSYWFIYKNRQINAVWQ